LGLLATVSERLNKQFLFKIRTKQNDRGEDKWHE